MNTTEKNINTILDHAINTMNNFYQHFYNWCPDDDFSNYIDADKKPIDPTTATRLNYQLRKLWELCDIAGVDIYELGSCLGNRSHDMVTAYMMDGNVHIGLKNKEPFSVNGYVSEDLGDGMETIYFNL